MKGVSLDLWECIATAGGTYRGTLYLAIAGIPRLGEESRLARIRKALIRENKILDIIYWTLDCKVHQEDDLPAKIRPSNHILGSEKSWWKNGKRHRKAGPAIIAHGYFAWWENGKRRREEGPTVPEGYRYFKML